MTHITSRRGMLGMTIAAPAIAAIGITAAHAATIDKTEWNALVTELQHRAATMQRLASEDDAAQRLHDVLRKDIGPRPQKPRIPFPRPVSEMTVGEISRYDITEQEQVQYDAAMAEWKRRDGECERRSGVDKTFPAWEAALTAHSDKADELLAYPAPDAEALLYKVTLAETEYRGADLGEEVKGYLFADIRRLIGGEG